MMRGRLGWAEREAMRCSIIEQPRKLLFAWTVASILLPPFTARADVTHNIVLSALYSFEGRWGLAYEVGWPGNANEERSRNRLLLRGHIGAAYTVGQFESDDADGPTTSASGATIWAGINLGWARVRLLVNNKPLELAINAVVAPVVTIFEQWATRLNISIRPGFRIRYNSFIFSFGMSLEVTLAKTEHGPWADVNDESALLPGADIALGVAF